MGTAPRSRSTLHLQLGQETIYLIMGIAVFAAIMMAAVIKRDREVEKDPPIIAMREANGYFFPTASAEVTPQFRAKLVREIVPLVASIGKRANAQVVEVIGHTDEVPMSARTRAKANLDETLQRELAGQSDPEKPVQAADNAGLGMARAVAVVQVLRSSPELSGFQIFPISAGAFQRTDDSMASGDDAKDDQERRRIEIRVRRRAQEVVQAGAK